MKYLYHIFFLIFINLSSISFADYSELEENKIIIIENKIKEAFKDLNKPKVFITKMEGVYAIVDRKNIYYTDYSLENFIVGKFYNKLDSKNENINFRSLYNKSFLERLNKNKLIKYQAPKEKSFLYVFSDITCPFCKKFHLKKDFFLEKGYSLYYIPFPRNGRRDKASVEGLGRIVCSDNPQNSFDKAFKDLRKYLNQEKIELCSKAPIIWNYYNLANDLGVIGTPAIYTENGTLVGGFKNEHRLLKLIEEVEKSGDKVK